MAWLVDTLKQNRYGWQAQATMWALLLMVGLATAGPLTVIGWRSFQVQGPGTSSVVYGLDNWFRVFTQPGLVTALSNSVLLALAIFLLATPLSIIFSWLVSCTDIPFKGFLEFALKMGFFLPLISQALGWMLLLDPDHGLFNRVIKALPFSIGPIDIYSFGGIVLAHLGFSVSARFLLICPAFKRMDPALEDAARMSGSSIPKTILTITVPILAPSIIGASLLGFLKSLESFEVVLLLGAQNRFEVYGTKIYRLLTTMSRDVDFAGAAALSMVMLLMVFILVAVYRWVVAGRTEGFATVTGKGFSPRVIELGGWRWPIFAGTMLFVVLIILVPSAVVVLGSFMKLFGFFDIPSPYTLNHWVTALQDNLFLVSLKNTMLLGFGSGIVGVVLYLFISYAVIRSNFRGSNFLDLLSWLPWTLPGIMLGLGLLWLFLENNLLVGLYGTLYGLVVAMVIAEMPVGVQMLKGSLMQVSRELEEVSLVTGASWLTTVRRVLLPIMLPSLLGVGLIVLITAVRNVQLVVLLSSHTTRPLSLLMVDFISGAQWGAASVIGVILVLLIVAALVISNQIEKRVQM